MSEAPGAADHLAALARVRARIDDAALAAGRSPGDVRLLLAVKRVDAFRIRSAISAGATVLGQNRAQELTAIEPELADLPHETHFIGQLQSNKVGAVLRWVTCVQSVDSPALAERLDRAAAARGRDLDVLVQVNTSGEATKAGIQPTAAPELAALVGALPHLTLRGFMTVGANSPDRDEVRRSYDCLANVRDAVVTSATAGTGAASELSMGMSRDVELAIAAGATMVRIGSAVFGQRT